jgi:hypothetical protein
LQTVPNASLFAGAATRPIPPDSTCSQLFTIAQRSPISQQDRHQNRLEAPPENVSWALAFTADDCLDIGGDLGSPGSEDYFDQAPFASYGKIVTTNITYSKK